MINWIIIAVLIFAILFFFKVSHTSHKIKIVIFIIIILIIYISATSLLSRNNVSIDSVQGFGNAVSLYFNWLGSTGKAIWNAGDSARDLIGNAVKGNSTG